MNISNLSVAELKDLLNQIPKEIQRRQKDEKAKLLKEIELLAAERGFALDEVIADIGSSKNGGKKAGGTVAIKYRHPQHSDLAWTGRGRQPKWVAEFLAQGGTLEQLLV